MKYLCLPVTIGVRVEEVGKGSDARPDFAGEDIIIFILKSITGVLKQVMKKIYNITLMKIPIFSPSS